MWERQWINCRDFTVEISPEQDVRGRGKAARSRNMRKGAVTVSLHSLPLLVDPIAFRRSPLFAFIPSLSVALIVAGQVNGGSGGWFCRTVFKTVPLDADCCPSIHH